MEGSQPFADLFDVSIAAKKRSVGSTPPGAPPLDRGVLRVESTGCPGLPFLRWLCPYLRLGSFCIFCLRGRLCPPNEERAGLSLADLAEGGACFVSHYFQCILWQAAVSRYRLPTFRIS